MDAIKNVPKEEIEEEEKIDIETHFLPATPVSEEDPLQRLHYSLYYHTMLSFKRSVSRDISGLFWHVQTDLSLNKDRCLFLNF